MGGRKITHYPGILRIFWFENFNKRIFRVGDFESEIRFYEFKVENLKLT